MAKSESRPSGCNPVFINALTYIGTMTVFLIAFTVPGIRIPYFPATGCLIPGDSSHSKFVREKNMGYLFVVLWEIHFFRRTVEVLFVHEYRRSMPCIESIGAPVYYWIFAFWNGVAIRHDNDYKQTYMPMAIVGCLIFLVGEVGNCCCHMMLRSFRKRKRESYLSIKSKHVIPSGFMFELVSCPHYFFEIMSWIGFMLATWTLASVVFLVASASTLFSYAYRKHKAYLVEFDGLANKELYPRNRKALIPFIF